MVPDAVFKASTEGVPESAKAEYWSSMLGEVWGNIHVEPTNLEAFEGSIKSVKSSQLTFNEISYRGQNIQRTPSNIARMKQDFYVLAFPKGAPWQMRVLGETFTLEPGKIYLGSNTVPYKSVDKRGYDTFNIMIPSQIIQDLVPSPKVFYTFPLGPANKKAMMLRDFANSIYACLPFSDDDDARFMEDHLLNLLAFLIQEKTQRLDADDSSVKLAHRNRVLSYIGRNLADESMCPESIAHQNGISVSYLHRVLKPYGKTVVEVIRTKRLEAARQILENPQLAGLSVTEVAYQVGFKHPSDFSRAYKGRYGYSPKEARSRHIQ